MQISWINDKSGYKKTTFCAKRENSRICIPQIKSLQKTLNTACLENNNKPKNDNKDLPKVEPPR